GVGQLGVQGDGLVEVGQGLGGLPAAEALPGPLQRHLGQQVGVLADHRWSLHGRHTRRVVPSPPMPLQQRATADHSAFCKRIANSTGLALPYSSRVFRTSIRWCGIAGSVAGCSGSKNSASVGPCRYTRVLFSSTTRTENLSVRSTSSNRP